MDYINKIGNFTQIAVKDFEENIVNKTNYLESINKNTFEEEYKLKEDKNE